MNSDEASSRLAHYKAILAYDGTNFSGFQRQANFRTVQGEVETALHRLGWTQRSILAAGRTDTGVHASGQVITFTLDWTRSEAALVNALNAHLPADIAFRQISMAPKGFHPRFDAQARLYRYTLFCDPARDPVRERYAWRVWPPVESSLLHEAAQALVGEHDFRAFGTPPRPHGSTVRHVSVARWQAGEGSSPDLVFEIEANAFLFHMVRRIVRLLVTIAQTRLPLESIALYLNNYPINPVKGLAPPHGLNLSAVRYPELEL